MKGVEPQGKKDTRSIDHKQSLTEETDLKALKGGPLLEISEDIKETGDKALGAEMEEIAMTGEMINSERTEDSQEIVMRKEALKKRG